MSQTVHRENKKATAQEYIPTLSEIAATHCDAVAFMAKGSISKPDIFRLNFQSGHESIVVKTYALKPFWVRATIGWFVTQREYRQLQRLQHIEGICRPALPASRSGIYLKWIPGKPLSEYSKNILSAKTFHCLEEIVANMHDAGVVHLDLGHKGNILITPDGHPFLIDFQTALYVKWMPALLKKALEKIDRLTLLKWKEKRFSAILTSEERQACRRRKRMVFLWPGSHHARSS